MTDEMERKLDLLLQIQGEQLQREVVLRLLGDLTEAERTALRARIVDRCDKVLGDYVENELRRSVGDLATRTVIEHLKAYLSGASVAKRLETAFRKAVTDELIERAVQDAAPPGLRSVVSTYVRSLLKP